MSLIAQAKLLRVSRSGASAPGGQSSRSTRPISATNRPLEQFVRDTRFREDRTTGSTRSRSGFRRCGAAGRYPGLAARFGAPIARRRLLPTARARKRRSKRSAPILARQHPRAGKTVSRGAVGAGPIDSAVGHRFLHATTTIAPITGDYLPSLAEASARTSSARRRPTGTRRRRRGSSASAGHAPSKTDTTQLAPCGSQKSTLEA